MELRIVTYNIHKGIGSDRRYRPGRTIDVLRSLNADVIALQEVDQNVSRSSGHDMAAMIAEELGMDYRFALNVSKEEGGYGNATLSRLPFVHSTNLNITWTIKKKRGCLISTLQWGGEHVVVLNFHLGLAGMERARQVNMILSSWHQKTIQNHPAIILGDSNDRADKLDPILSVAGFHNVSRRKDARTFPAFAPMWRLDKVYISRHFQVKDAVAVRDPTSRICSDHLPFLVTLAPK